mmetsp:Transcript_19816/g.28677  ORF Transcript_19816/g.28677 Transcript_19816/m.28677 type:complete len:202 (+) Transcript_19816:409-1014(+)
MQGPHGEAQGQGRVGAHQGQRDQQAAEGREPASAQVVSHEANFHIHHQQIEQEYHGLRVLPHQLWRRVHIYDSQHNINNEGQEVSQRIHYAQLRHLAPLSICQGLVTVGRRGQLSAAAFFFFSPSLVLLPLQVKAHIGRLVHNGDDLRHKYGVQHDAGRGPEVLPQAVPLGPRRQRHRGLPEAGPHKEGDHPTDCPSHDPF